MKVKIIIVDSGHGIIAGFRIGFWITSRSSNLSFLEMVFLYQDSELYYRHTLKFTDIRSSSVPLQLIS